MIVKLCDRCGERVDSVLKNPPKKKVPLFDIRRKVGTVSEEWFRVDLCPECTIELNNWICDGIGNDSE